MSSSQEKLVFHLKLLLVLGLIDTVSTIAWISSGLAIEANPLMRVLLDHSYLAFATVKLAMTLLGVSLLYINRDNKHTLKGVIIANIFYTIVAAWHIIGIGYVI